MVTKKTKRKKNLVLRPKEPMAFAVYCPIGHEFDYRLFAEQGDAEDYVEEVRQSGNETPDVIPLFP